MSKGRIAVAVAAVVTLMALTGVFGTNDSNADQNQLRLLVYDGEDFAEFTLDLSVDELLAYFSEPLVAQLLDGERVHLSTPDAVAGIEDLLDIPVTMGFQDIFGLYADQHVQDATWTCIKCCYASPPMACCCKPKEPDE